MKIYTPFLVFLLAAFSSSATVKLPALVGDNMVLQQNTAVKLWGEATPGKTVTVSVSWAPGELRTKADKDGRWQLQVNTPEADYTPRSITLTEGETVVLQNILIGEVWLASGQSNMEMPLNGFWNSPVEGANLLIATARSRPYIRMFTVEKDTALVARSDCRGNWQESTPAHLPWWSATAYHYAMTLQCALGVPIGIIHCSWGGTKVESWMPAEDLQAFDDVRLADTGDPQVPLWLKPCLMYYGMMAPCRNYTVRGFIWYQGCSNVGGHRTYARKMQTLVRRLRNDRNAGELPFYYVEIAPYEYGEGIDGALLREAQFNAQQLIPASGLVCTNDLVTADEAGNIHPRDKAHVGQRLAFWALTYTYGEQGICCTGPSYKSAEFRDGKAYIRFDNADDGFWPWKDITGFEIAGADRRFFPATARLDTDRKIVVVSAGQVSEPVAVRYCFKNFQQGNLKNHRGLPVYPFRTDRFE